MIRRWEYSATFVNLTGDAASKRTHMEELKALGLAGWRMVGVVTIPPGQIQFYFERELGPDEFDFG